MTFCTNYYIVHFHYHNNAQKMMKVNKVKSSWETWQRDIKWIVKVDNEAEESRLSQNKPGILCKSDIENAYDHVNWEFLLKILRLMGFWEKWSKWVKFGISAVKFSALINGAPEGLFNAHRGIRQGDPLPPFLFIS